MIKKKTSGDPLRKALSQCVGKICAYLAVGKTAEAKIWAQTLVNELKKAALIS